LESPHGIGSVIGRHASADLVHSHRSCPGRECGTASEIAEPWDGGGENNQAVITPSSANYWREELPESERPSMIATRCGHGGRRTHKAVNDDATSTVEACIHQRPGASRSTQLKKSQPSSKTRGGGTKRTPDPSAKDDRDRGGGGFSRLQAHTWRPPRWLPQGLLVATSSVFSASVSCDTRRARRVCGGAGIKLLPNANEGPNIVSHSQISAPSSRDSRNPVMWERAVLI